MSTSPNSLFLPYTAIDDENCSHRHILKEPTARINFPLSTEDRKLAEILFYQTSHEENCAGLAAPQIGFSKAMIAFQVDEEVKNFRFDVHEAVPTTLLINPNYQGIGEEKTIDWEGCFSVNGTMGEVPRFTTISYEGFDLEGNLIKGIAKGFLARLLQHEIDHINGILFFDRIPPELRFGPKEKMREIRLAELELKKRETL